MVQLTSRSSSKGNSSISCKYQAAAAAVLCQGSSSSSSWFNKSSCDLQQQPQLGQTPQQLQLPQRQGQQLVIASS